MAMTLYELVGRDDRRFSPFCWRTRLALAHKGLAAEIVPVGFTEKETIAFSGQEKVPVLVDGDKVISDSWAIADYLDDAYPDRPPLFGNDAARGAALFVNFWTDRQLQGDLFGLIVADILDHCRPEDRDYFRDSRERRFNKSLAEVQAGREDRLPAFRARLEPLRATVKRQPFLAGAAPAYVDFIPFSSLQWARGVSPFKLLEDDDPVRAWALRLCAAFDGLADSVPVYPL